MSFCEWEWFKNRFDALEASIGQLRIQLKTQGDKIMAQIDDLNAAITAEDVEVQDLLPVVTKIDTDIAALAALVASGSTPPDLSAQIQAIQSHTASLVTAIQQLSDADNAAVPPVVPAAKKA